MINKNNINLVRALGGAKNLSGVKFQGRKGKIIFRVVDIHKVRINKNHFVSGVVCFGYPNFVEVKMSCWDYKNLFDNVSKLIVANSQICDIINI